MEVDEGSDQKSDLLSPLRMTAHANLKNEFTEDKKCQNLMSWLILEHTTVAGYKKGGRVSQLSLNIDNQK